MKKKSNPYKKLAKSQKKLKQAFANLGKSGKNAENPVWVTALAAVAGAVATALADRDKRTQLKDIAVEAKDKAVGLLEKPKKTDADDLEQFEKETEETHHHV